MQEIYIENIRKLMQNKKKLESVLDISISNKGKLVFVDGEADKEFLALEVLKAINLDFSINQALMIKKEGFSLHILNIKDVTKRNDLKRVRARIIGSRGKTLNTLKNLSDCEFSINDNTVGIIGHSDDLEKGVAAVTSIIKGSKQSNIYSRLEKEKRNKRLQNKNPDFIKNELE